MAEAFFSMSPVDWNISFSKVEQIIRLWQQLWDLRLHSNQHKNPRTWQYCCFTCLMVLNNAYVSIQQSHWWLPQGHIHDVCKGLLFCVKDRLNFWAGFYLILSYFWSRRDKEIENCGCLRFCCCKHWSQCIAFHPLLEERTELSAF